MNVRWKPSALDQLADYYASLPLPEQRALAATVERINAELAADPLALGESRDSAGRRVWFPGPLVVIFRVEARGVFVTHARPQRSGD